MGWRREQIPWASVDFHRFPARKLHNCYIARVCERRERQRPDRSRGVSSWIRCGPNGSGVCGDDTSTSAAAAGSPARIQCHRPVRQLFRCQTGCTPSPLPTLHDMSSCSSSPYGVSQLCVHAWWWFDSMTVVTLSDCFCDAVLSYCFH